MSRSDFQYIDATTEAKVKNGFLYVRIKKSVYKATYRIAFTGSLSEIYDINIKNFGETYKSAFTYCKFQGRLVYTKFF